MGWQGYCAQPVFTLVSWQVDKLTSWWVGELVSFLVDGAFEFVSWSVLIFWVNEIVGWWVDGLLNLWVDELVNWCVDVFGICWCFCEFIKLVSWFILLFVIWAWCLSCAGITKTTNSFQYDKLILGEQPLIIIIKTFRIKVFFQAF